MKKQHSLVMQQQQLIHHVKEIQARLLCVVAVLLLGMAVGFFYYEQLFNIIRLPLHTDLHYTSPAGSFNFVIEVCFVVGIIVTLPVAVYNAIMFLQPALSTQLSRSRVYLTTFFSLALAASGALFAFLIILPLALKFFFKFQVDGLVALISANDYLNFVVNIVVTFVIIFQLPLLLTTIDHIKPLSLRTLIKGEKYIIVLGFAIALIVPFAMDPIVQLLIASPIIILYNIAIVSVLVQHAFRKKTRTNTQTIPAPVLPVRTNSPSIDNQSSRKPTQKSATSTIQPPRTRPAPPVRRPAQPHKSPAIIAAERRAALLTAQKARQKTTSLMRTKTMDGVMTQSPHKSRANKMQKNPIA
jgi:sec-independent protein translocase protein TatC